MNPGTLRSRITIEKKALTDNGFGGMGETWSTLATVWAKVEHLTGRELTLAQQISPEINFEITIRYRTDITTDQRILYNNRYYNIRDVKDLDNLHKILYLKCEVVQSGQV